MALAMRKRGNMPPMESFARQSFVLKHTTQRRSTRELSARIGREAQGD
jgi:hypothetical protein